MSTQSVVTNIVDDMTDVAVARKLHDYLIKNDHAGFKTLLTDQLSNDKRDWECIFNQWPFRKDTMSASSQNRSYLDHRKDNKKLPILITAIQKDLDPFIETILSSFSKSSKYPTINFNVGDNLRQPTLYHAMFKKNIKLTKRLIIDHGSDINSCSRDGQSLLHLAILDLDLEMIKFVLNYNSNINDNDKFDWNKHIRTIMTYKLSAYTYTTADIFTFLIKKRKTNKTTDTEKAIIINILKYLFKFQENQKIKLDISNQYEIRQAMENKDDELIEIIKSNIEFYDNDDKCKSMVQVVLKYDDVGKKLQETLKDSKDDYLKFREYLGSLKGNMDLVKMVLNFHNTSKHIISQNNQPLICMAVTKNAMTPVKMMLELGVCTVTHFVSSFFLVAISLHRFFVPGFFCF